MKKRFLPIYILSVCCLLTSSRRSNEPELTEIDYFKIDYNHNFYDNILLFFDHFSMLPYIRNVKTDWGKLGLRGKVKTMYEASDDKKHTFTFTNDKKHTFTFNEDGNVTACLLESFYVARHTYLYDDEKKLIKVRKEQLGETDSSIWEYDVEERDVNGRLKDAEYGGNGLITSFKFKYMLLTHRYFYDEKGQLIKEMAVNEDNPEDPSVAYRMFYKYDDTGRCIEKEWEEVTLDDDDEWVSILHTESFTYNKQHDIAGIKIMSVRSLLDAERRDTSFQQVAYQYKYDAQGNWTIRTNPADKEDVRKRIITYY
jgi:YD repeat-containing protein